MLPASWCGRLALLLCAMLAADLVRADSGPQIAVLLRQHAGRDADLDARPLREDERASLERAAAVPLVPLRVESDGSQVLALPVGFGERERAGVLQALRALPEVVYAEALEIEVFPPGAAVSLAEIDRLVIKLKDRSSRDDSDAGRPLSRETIRALGRRAGVPLYYERPVSGGAHALRLFQRMPPASVAAIAVRLETDPSVAYAEPSVRGRFGVVPEDPLFARQWPLFSEGGGIRAPEAWQRTTGDERVVVAVLDSGVLRLHPDLHERLLPGWDFVSDVRRSSDLDGRDPDPTDPGDDALRDECASGSPASAATWHGTHVAGTIGAAAQNGIGITGVDWKARILPVRVGAKCGIDPIDLVDALRWAAGASAGRIPDVAVRNPHPARVLNLSMEFPGPCPRSLQEAIRDATAAGALVVAAAGNQARPASGFYPANCRGVLTVHATDIDGGRSPYSNYGAVDLSAPGGVMAFEPDAGVLSTSFRSERGTGTYDYTFKEGTSMAAPLVAGVASLVLSVRPALAPGPLRNLLARTARPFPVGTASDCVDAGPLSCGAGIVDAAAAVAAAD